MNPMSVRELDLLPYKQKVLHWDGEDPWSPPEGLYRFSNPALPRFRVTMDNGHIKRMPLVVGRPCFGIMTAYLRFRAATKFVRGRGQQPSSRCGSCKIRPECRDVVERRIRSSLDISSAHQAWLLADGPSDIVTVDWRSRTGGKWRRLVTASTADLFESSNDVAVALSYAQQDLLAQEKDRERQRKNRERGRKRGVLDDQHRHDLDIAVARRAVRVVEAVREARTAGRPPSLAKLPNLSVRELLEVWHGREWLRAEKKLASGAAISRWIMETGKSNETANLNALQARVSKDLKRISAFEQAWWKGDLLLPPLDAASEFTT